VKQAPLQIRERKKRGGCCRLFPSRLVLVSSRETV
jgi:hypothetical protein